MLRLDAITVRFRMRTTTLALLCALALASAPAAALTIANDGEETVNVWIEKWLYRLRGGKTATFNPSSEPVTVLIESRHWRITCEADAASEVRVAENLCVVDGVEVGASQFQL